MDKCYGITTLYRWISEPLPVGLRAYLEWNGRLFRLDSLTVMNGVVQPTLTCLLCTLNTFQPVCDTYSLFTAVFLCREPEDLAGRYVKTVAPFVVAANGAWGLNADALVGAAVERVKERGNESSLQHCG